MPGGLQSVRTKEDARRVAMELLRTAPPGADPDALLAGAGLAAPHGGTSRETLWRFDMPRDSAQRSVASSPALRRAPSDLKSKLFPRDQMQSLMDYVLEPLGAKQMSPPRANNPPTPLVEQARRQERDQESGTILERLERLRQEKAWSGEGVAAEMSLLDASRDTVAADPPAQAVPVLGRSIPATPSAWQRKEFDVPASSAPHSASATPARQYDNNSGQPGPPGQPSAVMGELSVNGPVAMPSSRPPPPTDVPPAQPMVSSPPSAHTAASHPAAKSHYPSQPQVPVAQQPVTMPAPQHAQPAATAPSSQPTGIYAAHTTSQHSAVAQSAASQQPTAMPSQHAHAQPMLSAQPAAQHAEPTAMQRPVTPQRLAQPVSQQPTAVPAPQPVPASHLASEHALPMHPAHAAAQHAQPAAPSCQPMPQSACMYATQPPSTQHAPYAAQWRTSQAPSVPPSLASSPQQRAAYGMRNESPSALLPPPPGGMQDAAMAVPQGQGHGQGQLVAPNETHALRREIGGLRDELYLTKQRVFMLELAMQDMRREKEGPIHVDAPPRLPGPPATPTLARHAPPQQLRPPPRPPPAPTGSYVSPAVPARPWSATRDDSQPRVQQGVHEPPMVTEEASPADTAEWAAGAGDGCTQESVLDVGFDPGLQRALANPDEHLEGPAGGPFRLAASPRLPPPAPEVSGSHTAAMAPRGEPSAAAHAAGPIGTSASQRELSTAAAPHACMDVSAVPAPSTHRPREVSTSHRDHSSVAASHTELATAPVHSAHAPVDESSRILFPSHSPSPTASAVENDDRPPRSAQVPMSAPSPPRSRPESPPALAGFRAATAAAAPEPNLAPTDAAAPGGNAPDASSETGSRLGTRPLKDLLPAPFRVRTNESREPSWEPAAVDTPSENDMLCSAEVMEGACAADSHPAHGAMAFQSGPLSPPIVTVNPPSPRARSDAAPLQREPSVVELSDIYDQELRKSQLQGPHALTHATPESSSGAMPAARVSTLPQVESGVMLAPPKSAALASPQVMPLAPKNTMLMIDGRPMVSESSACTTPREPSAAAPTLNVPREYDVTSTLSIVSRSSGPESEPLTGLSMGTTGTMGTNPQTPLSACPPSTGASQARVPELPASIETAQPPAAGDRATSPDAVNAALGKMFADKEVRSQALHSLISALSAPKPTAPVAPRLVSTPPTSPIQLENLIATSPAVPSLPGQVRLASKQARPNPVGQISPRRAAHEALGLPYSPNAPATPPPATHLDTALASLMAPQAPAAFQSPASGALGDTPEVQQLKTLLANQRALERGMEDRRSRASDAATPSARYPRVDHTLRAPPRAAGDWNAPGSTRAFCTSPPGAASAASLAPGAAFFSTMR